MTAQPDRILVLIPCYGCAPQIGRVLTQFDEETSRYFAEILVLDNGSRDGTVEAAIAAAPRAHVRRVTVARNRENYNLGGSHKAAFAYASSAGFSHVVVLHGDDQGDIRELLPLLAAGTHREYDACLGARFMRGSRLIGYSRFRIFGNRVFNALFGLGARAQVVDLGSGLNIFSREIFEDSAHIRNADDLRFNVYLLLRAIDQKRRLLFFPISWREDDQISNVKMFSQARKTLGILNEYLFNRSAFRTTDHRAKRHESYTFDVVATNDGKAGNEATPGEKQGLALVMPMAGRGSRFARNGEPLPKPLIDLHGRPFFWWAVESVRKYAQVRELMFVVLEEHCRDFKLDQRILEYFPEARILRLAEVTSGAAETARVGVAALNSDGPIAINDCDHAFLCPTLGAFAEQTAASAAGALLCFRSDSPAYSYAMLGGHGKVTGTVEKQVVSPLAIAGCYLFANRDVFARAYGKYSATCTYNELFISGLYNTMIADGAEVLAFELARHCTFGTPEELARANLGGIAENLLPQGAAR